MPPDPKFILFFLPPLQRYLLRIDLQFDVILMARQNLADGERPLHSTLERTSTLARSSLVTLTAVRFALLSLHKRLSARTRRAHRDLRHQVIAPNRSSATTHAPPDRTNVGRYHPAPKSCHPSPDRAPRIDVRIGHPVLQIIAAYKGNSRLRPVLAACISRICWTRGFPR